MKNSQIITVLWAVCFLLTACSRTESTVTEQTAISESQGLPETTVQGTVDNEPTSKAIEQMPQNVSEENAYADEINELMEMDLMTASPDSSYGSPDGDKDFYAEAQSKYSELLNSFIDLPSNYELFGGAYFQNGYLHIMVTDMDSSEFISDTIGDENIIVKECDFSYSYLEQVKHYIDSLALGRENGLDSYIVSIVDNAVLITASTDDAKAYLYDVIEEGGYDKGSVEISVTDSVIANPA